MSVATSGDEAWPQIAAWLRQEARERALQRRTKRQQAKRRRFYQPDFDVEALEVVPRLTLSTAPELRLLLHWVAILYGRVPVDLALTTGVHDAEGVIKAIMAGASVTMLASELLANGVGRLREILGDLVAWLEQHEYISVAQMKGSMSQQAVAEPAAFERANYMKMLHSFQTRVR